MHAIPSLALVVCALAMALGLAAIAAGLPPIARVPGDAARNHPSMVAAGAATMEPTLRGSGDDRAKSLATSTAPTPVPLLRASAAGPWRSPLYPQNGVTLWDRIRSSLPQDQRANLTGIAIQIHAPATAAEPGARAALLPCCPRLWTTNREVRPTAVSRPNAGWAPGNGSVQ